MKKHETTERIAAALRRSGYDAIRIPEGLMVVDAFGELRGTVLVDDDGTAEGSPVAIERIVDRELANDRMSSPGAVAVRSAIAAKVASPGPAKSRSIRELLRAAR